MRAAARMVRCAQRFQSKVVIKFGGQVANARNILSIIALCAALGAALEIETVGDDEQEALVAMEAIFKAPDGAPVDVSTV